ncbi:hypothetical protein PanWU01x14_163250 [Parasponia andersonii]|uniref:Uncharacterized protein n=1 Tax=Parasponia andersonii TaxID=3476 RepID=A0A2P5CCM7_PARAD|nr:hypothetical protein PanWU01x14_163250 [Parasponia andersonii]
MVGELQSRFLKDWLFWAGLIIARPFFRLIVLFLAWGRKKKLWNVAIVAICWSLCWKEIIEFLNVSRGMWSPFGIESSNGWLFGCLVLKILKIYPFLI